MTTDLLNFFDYKFQMNVCSKLSTHKLIKGGWINVQGEPTASYKWTCLSLRINQLKLKTLRGLLIILDEHKEYISNQ
jgi:hypothetical protein